MVIAYIPPTHLNLLVTMKTLNYFSPSKAIPLFKTFTCEFEKPKLSYILQRFSARFDFMAYWDFIYYINKFKPKKNDRQIDSLPFCFPLQLRVFEKQIGKSDLEKNRINYLVIFFKLATRYDNKQTFLDLLKVLSLKKQNY